MAKERGNRNEKIALMPVLGGGKTSRNVILRVVMDSVNYALNSGR